MCPFIFKVPPVLSNFELQKILASDRAAGDEFGWSVAISGTTLVIGASLTDHSALIDAGSAYVYEKSGSSWVQVQILIASDASGYADFGRSVAISGTTIVVGAYHDDPNAISDAGAAYVFEKATTWPATETQKLLPSDPAANDFFGRSVEIVSNMIVVGANNHGDGGILNAGAAYVFEKATTWAETRKLLPTDPAADDTFGIDVAISADAIVVGARFADPDGLSKAGSAYVFGV